nr:nuclear transport factor 2 family protein [uncultured Holophaga sp.]
MRLGAATHGLLSSYLSAVETGDLDSLLACFASDIEFQLAETTPVLVGKDALRAFYEERWHSFSGQKALRRRSFTNGLEVITMAEIEVTIPEMGEGFFILPIAQRFVFDSSGLIVKLTDFLDFKSAIRAHRL